MDEKERYRAEIYAKLIKFGESLHDLTTKKELREANRPEIEIDNLLSKHEQAKAKLKDLGSTDTDTWQQEKSEMDLLINDIEKEFREALAYFK
jgi:hypothetical protein